MKRYVYYAIIALALIFSTLQAQQKNRVIVAKVKQGVFLENKQAPTLDDLASTRIGMLLSSLQCKSIRKVFPHFSAKDTNSFDLNGRPIKLIDLSRWYRMEFDAQVSSQSIETAISRSGFFEGVHEDGKIQRTDTFPNEIPLDDPAKQRAQWGLYNPDTRPQIRDINAPAAWDFQRGRNDVVVAVVDDGVDHNHLDLDPGDRSRVIQGWAVPSQDENTLPQPGDIHGTCVAGVIGAITNNGNVYGQNSIAGVMWNCKILPLRATEDLSENAEAIEWARQHGAHIINASFAAPEDPLHNTEDFKEAVTNAWIQGILLCASMGNDGTDEWRLPAGCFGSMAIGASDQNDVVVSTSNHNSYISVVAPGTAYRTTSPGGTYYPNFGGTSLSTPLVAGSAGLILSESFDRNLGLTSDDLKHLLESSADKVAGMTGLPWTDHYGFGRINVGTAIRHLNLPYQITRGTLTASGGELTRDTHRREFNDDYYLGGLGHGVYMVKQYKVSWQVTFPDAYEETPYVWIRERETNGWWGDDGQSTYRVEEVPWAQVSNISNTGFTVTTYIYFFVSDLLGQEINKYWPGNTSSIQATVNYTAIGWKSLAAPTALSSAPVSANCINLSWHDNSDNESGFIVERSSDGTTFVEIGHLVTNGNGPGNRAYEDNTVQPGTTYTYRVVAYAQQFRSPYSNLTQNQSHVHLTSIVSSATGPSTQRKTVTHNTITHAVYESGGYVWYMRNPNDGSGWSTEILLSDPTNPTAKNPSIAFSAYSGPHLGVVYEEARPGYPTQRRVNYRVSANEGLDWAGPYDVSNGWEAQDGDRLPAIGTSGTDRFAVAWRGTSNGSNFRIQVALDPLDSHGSLDDVPSTNGCDYPSLAGSVLGSQPPRYELAYKSSEGAIYYREFTRRTEPPFNADIGPATMLSTGYSNATKPCVTSTRSGDRVFVAWEADVLGGGHHVFVSERSGTTWLVPTEFMHGADELRNSSIFVNESETTPQVYVTYECVAGGSVVNLASKHRPLASPTSPWRALRDLGPGYSPSNPAWAGSGDGQARSIWVTGTSAPFNISTYTLVPPTTLACNVLNAWNMTGIPLEAYDFAKAAVYPTATSNAFAYIPGQGYVITDPLSTDRGWFIKFGSAQSITYEGDWISFKRMVVGNGWNIIGSISTPIQVANVYSEPPNIVASVFSGYDGGRYIPTDILQPGGGYWVKTNAAGYIVLDANHQAGGGGGLDLASYDKFTISDALQTSQDLYIRNGVLAHTTENIPMPPAPPDSAFDVRFQSGDIVRTVFPDSGGTSLSIALNSVVYPVQVVWDVHPENGISYFFTPDSGGGLGKPVALTSLPSSSKLEISHRGSGVIHLAMGAPQAGKGLPTEYALHQNFPNPFNPSTKIQFDLPQPGAVSLILYDILGRKVVDLANGYHEAGYHSATWNASGQASGVYFARFSVTNAQGGIAYTRINKLMLVR